jgi:hypothetical protein
MRLAAVLSYAETTISDVIIFFVAGDEEVNAPLWHVKVP